MEQEARPVDVPGIISLVLGLLATFGCVGSCVPYLGIVFMMASFALSLGGTIAGALGVMRLRGTDDSSVVSGAGLALSGVILAIWLLYIVFMVVMMALLVVGLIAVAILDA